MDNELLKYLTDEEKKRIVERVYEEEVRNYIKEDISKRSPSIFEDNTTVYTRILNQYIKDLDLYHYDFIDIFKKRLEEEMDNIINGNSTEIGSNSLRTVIEWKIRDIGEEIINESKDELRPIIKEKVFKCCNETLLIAFLSDIVRGMNLDKAVKNIIQETEGDKK